MVLADRAEGLDLAPADIADRVFQVIEARGALLQRHGRELTIGEKQGLDDRQFRRVEVGEEGVAAAGAGGALVARPTPTKPHLAQFVEEAVERVVHQEHERVRIGEGRVDSLCAKQRLPPGSESGAMR